jgi:diguanylate cyclase (GGDEF)-like protein
MSGTLRDTLAGAFSDGGEHSDDLTTRWMGTLVLLLGALLSVVLVALVPPTAEGAWGWDVAALIIVARVVAASWLVSGRGPVRPRALYAVSALGIAGLCALQFLASSAAFYHDLLLIDLLFVAAVHTPRRASAAVLLAVAGLIPALLRHGPETVTWAEWGAEAILWTLVVGLVVLYTERSRGQRAQLREASRKAAALARVDQLTGLGNRRAFDETLARELSTARRHGTGLSVLVGDLDGFKAVNDRLGHPVGDDLLREVARRLVETVRRPDACFRWGGDEFAVVLPHTSPAGAQQVAARVHAAIAQHVRVPGAHGVGITFGIADLAPGQAAADLLVAADRALLAAKLARPTARRPAWRFGRGAVDRGGRRR